MKSFALTSTFCLTLFLCLGQKAPVKFGDVTIDELKMVRYEKDTSASAVVLVDFGETKFNYNGDKGWQLKFERITRIKIITKAGYEWANFSIPLYHNRTDREKISGLKAVTYNLENGKIVESKLKNDGTFEEKGSENIDLVKFTLPNIKEGSVIEVKYEINSDFIFNFQDWEFQSLVPVVWSEYRATFPEFFNYEKYLQGYIPLEVNDTKEVIQNFSVPYSSAPQRGGAVEKGVYELTSQSITNRWVAKHVPAFKEEPFLANYRDYISKINFELGYIKYPNEPIKPVMGNWEDLNANFLDNEYFGKAINGSGFLKKDVEEIIAGLSNAKEKINAIYNYVKSTVAWDGRYRKYIDNNLKKPIEEKKGSSAEINLLLTSMLRKANIVANPVIISTSNNGFVRENMAISSQFNYVICQANVDGKSVLLDATDRMLPMNLLPERCLNGNGYVISKESPGWVSLNSPKSKISASADVIISSTGEMKGTIKISNDGYDAYNMRKQYLDKGETEYVKNFTDNSSWSIEKSVFENIKVLHEPAIETYEFTHSENTDGADILYINPLIHLRIEENPFKLENRIYPVIYGKTSDRTLIYKFTIPENYQIEEIPTSKAFGLPGNAARYIYNVQATGNVIAITSMLSINQPVFTQMEYPNLREFYNQVVAKQAEQIVLKKK
jgi:transglutaminase-like putative cysteine protease